MGWIFAHGTRKQVIAELTAPHSDSIYSHETLRSCVRGSVLWAKHRMTYHDGEELVYVGCYLLRYERGCGLWGYKAMEEACGPNYYHCPLSYLEGLSDPVGYAADWRLRVRRYWADRKKQTNRKEIKP